MIIALSIVDKHKQPGKMHVGTIMLEVDYPSDSHFDFRVEVADRDKEVLLRPYLNKLMSRRDVDAMDQCIGVKA